MFATTMPYTSYEYDLKRNVVTPSPPNNVTTYYHLISAPWMTKFKKNFKKY